MNEKTSLMQLLYMMEVGDFHIFPFSEQPESTLRNYASRLGYTHGRIYHVKRNRAERNTLVSRAL